MRSPELRHPTVAPAAVPVLQVSGLTKRFGPVAAVDRVDLRVDRGEVLGLLGPNGSGKSTTLNLVLGFLRPDAGRVVIAGHDLARERTRALASVGGLVEGAAFYPYLSGRANLRMIARLRGLPLARVEELLELLDLRHAADRAYGGYSQGMRQRLGVAGALLHDPQLVVLDEPTSGLDPAGTREMRGFIPRIAGEGHTVILASHLLTEVEQVCHRVAIMQRGRLIATGTVEELLRSRGPVAVRVRPEDQPRARELLARLPGVQSVDGAGPDGAASDLLVDGDLPPEALNEALGTAGIWASRIEPDTATLESVFLELTEEAPQ